MPAAVVVWATVGGTMAYRPEESPWRWAFIALPCGDVLTIRVIFCTRRDVASLTKESEGDGRWSRDDCGYFVSEVETT